MFDKTRRLVGVLTSAEGRSLVVEVGRCPLCTPGGYVCEEHEEQLEDADVL